MEDLIQTKYRPTCSVRSCVRINKDKPLMSFSGFKEYINKTHTLQLCCLILNLGKWNGDYEIESNSNLSKQSKSSEEGNIFVVQRMPEADISFSCTRSDHVLCYL